MGYTKLFSDIVMSTIWREPDHVRILWITMLALREHDNVVRGSIPGLADAARITIEQCEDALSKLLAPDKYSRTKTNDGRRIEEVAGGWFIINGEFYRSKLSENDRREYNRKKQREYYAKKHDVQKIQNCTESVTIDQECTTCTQTETETETKKKERRKAASAPTSGDVGSVVGYFKKCFMTKHNVNYQADGKDHSSTKTLLKLYSKEQVFDLIDEFFELEHFLIQKNGHTLALVLSLKAKLLENIGKQLGVRNGDSRSQDSF